MPPNLFVRTFQLLLGRGERALHVRATGGAATILAVVMVAGSYAVVAAERGASGANLTSYPRALWWSVETATTVGYGDFYPITVWGRIIACVVMVAGITTFGVVTAAIATLFVGRDRKRHRLAEEAGERARRGERLVREDAYALHERFDRLERMLTASGPGAGGTGGGGPPG